MKKCVYVLALNYREFCTGLEILLENIGANYVKRGGQYIVGNACFHFVGEERHLRGARGFWAEERGALRSKNYGELRSITRMMEASGCLQHIQLSHGAIEFLNYKDPRSAGEKEGE